ncbi:MAG: chorismate-binding protein [Cytophagaceae bacterium]|jgi:para-aminobenzoate synthetase component 1|nr:chorismate-binding protein [Cytophagaceae bacterium]
MTFNYPTERSFFIEYCLQQALQESPYVAYFTDTQYSSYPNGGFDHVLAWGNVEGVDSNSESVDILSSFWLKNRFTCGHIGYTTYQYWNPNVPNKNKTPIDFPTFFWWEPEVVLRFNETNIEVVQGHWNPEHTRLFKKETTTAVSQIIVEPTCCIQPEVYFRSIEKIQEWLKRGDIYEINYCLPFYGKAKLNPYATYKLLEQKTPMPFSGLMRWNDNYIFSFSPERYLKQEQDTLWSQPIKGTAKRSIHPTEDNLLRTQLQQSEKERAENSMIVDLVRHDLSQKAIPGSVRVKEWCGVYSFPTVHQLISTIEAKIDVHTTTSWDMVQTTFPMGSMTGAPKHNALQFIESIEACARGPFSGTIGYKYHPYHMDLNVLIRSLFYSALSHDVYWEAGSAITIYADTEAEYRECLLKAEVIQSLFKK